MLARATGQVQAISGLGFSGAICTMQGAALYPTNVNLVMPVVTPDGKPEGLRGVSAVN